MYEAQFGMALRQSRAFKRRIRKADRPHSDSYCGACGRIKIVVNVLDTAWEVGDDRFRRYWVERRVVVAFGDERPYDRTFSGHDSVHRAITPEQHRERLLSSRQRP